MWKSDTPVSSSTHPLCQDHSPGEQQPSPTLTIEIPQSMGRLVPAPQRLARKLCRWLGIGLLITSVACLLFWAYTGRSPVANLATVVGSGSVAKLHLIAPGSKGLALCLDGTSPAVFVSHNAQSQDWIIYLGQDSLYWCIDDEDCLDRSSTMQGSSRGLPAELELHGVLSNSERVNPEFHSWSKAVIHACDGSGFLGHRAAPFHVSDKPLYSRGYHVFWRALEWLRREYHSTMEPHKARLLFVGQGSSGIALMIAAAAVREQFPYNRVKFALEGSVMPDAFPSLVDRLKQVTAMHQIASNPDLKGCTTEHGKNAGQHWRCLLLSGLHVTDHLADSAFFFSGSNYDRWLAVNILGIPCPIRDCRDDEQSFGKYHQLRLALMEALSPVDKKSAKDGIWMSSCWSRGHLVHDQLLTGITVEGLTLSEALRSWYFKEGKKSASDDNSSSNDDDNKKFIHLIDGQHPSNPTCPV